MVKERRTWDALKGLVDRLLRVDTLRLLRHEQDLQVLLARPGPLVCHVAQRLQVRRHERRVEARLHAVGETDVAGRDVEAVAVEAERLEAGGKVVRLEAGEGHSRNWLKKSRRGVNQNKRVRPFGRCMLTLRLEGTADSSVVGVEGRGPAY